MDYEDDFEDDRPSKSQMKRDADAAQRLGAELVELNAKQLAQFGLPDKLLEAIKHAQTINSHSAKKRQLQYIGKLMRDVDVGSVAEILARLKAPHRQAVAQFHQAEKWRERLLADDQQIAVFVAEYPAADVTELRKLIVDARQEKVGGQLGKAYRGLFKLITGLQAGRE